MRTLRRRNRAPCRRARCRSSRRSPLATAPLAVLRRAQQVELDLGVRVEREAAIGGPCERALEHVARIRDGGLPVGRRDVAEHARRRVDVAAPRERLERGGVGVREQVGSRRSGSTPRSRTCRTRSLGERPLDLGGAIATDFSADDVGEPEPDELDLALDGPRTGSRCLSIHTLSHSLRVAVSASGAAPSPDAACARLAACQSSP